MAGGYDALEGPSPADADWAGPKTYSDKRRRWGDVDPEATWDVVEGIGGEHGWYSFLLAWQVRGILDKLSGGYGLRRGRLSPNRLHPGDPVDWWRVEHIERPHRLLLRAEMKAPGRAWLEFNVAEKDGGTEYRQRAIFEPRGLGGELYWLGLLPFHAIIFPSMSKNILRAAAKRKRRGADAADTTVSKVHAEA